MPAEPYPSYPFPARQLLDLTLAALTGRRRCFRTQACQMIASMRPPLVIEGSRNLPLSGPAVITTNHYCRPGFWSPWFPAAISAAVPVDIYWTMTDAFTYPGHPLGKLMRMVTHWALTRAARTYQFNCMPPMPPAPGESAQRAASVQRLLRYARSNPTAVIGLAPEGGDQPGGVLGMPPDGFGRLALALGDLEMRFYPVGVYEAGGCLRVCFGMPYLLSAENLSDRREADLQARSKIMQAIAMCLPHHLHGVFGVPANG